MNDIVKIACWRTGPDWAQASSADMATSITIPAAMSPLSWREFKAGVIAGGGTEAELLSLYKAPAFYERFVAAIEAGDLAEVDDCKAEFGDVATIFGLTLSTATKQAANSVINAAKLRLIDVVAAELGETAPETVTAADVDAALGRNQL